ncbi:MAG: hypothetical protein QM764_03360 [Chitinophagaceae bacterium]
MRKSLPVLVLLLAGSLYASSQQLSQIAFANASTLSYFSFTTDQSILLRISEDGTLKEYGTELASERATNYYSPKLQPYMGRIDYFGNEADSSFKGKIKSIGTCYFTYYGAFEVEEKRGKLKTIGRTTLDYYTRFDNPAFKGKLKSAGSYNFDYYSISENDAVKGKLKTVGITRIVYNSTFDDKLIQGKVKSIGSVSYDWGKSTDAQGYGGALKSGSYRQNVDGITYILR